MSEISPSGNGFKLFSDVKSVSADDIEIGLPSDVEGKPDRIFVFGKYDKAASKQYSNLAYGQGRKKGNPQKAVLWLFGARLKAVKGLTEEEERAVEASQKSVKDIMLADPDYFVLIDSLIGRYILAATPDPEDLKSNG
jgi:hypothetical protein